MYLARSFQLHVAKIRSQTFVGVLRAEGKLLQLCVHLVQYYRHHKMRTGKRGTFGYGLSLKSSAQLTREKQLQIAIRHFALIRCKPNVPTPFLRCEFAFQFSR
jgi:hypothetical protein